MFSAQILNVTLLYQSNIPDFMGGQDLFVHNLVDIENLISLQKNNNNEINKYLIISYHFILIIIFIIIYYLISF